MVPEETQTSTSSTAAGITSGTECAGGDGPSSAVLGSAGKVSTDSNTVSVVSTPAGTHVVHGYNAVTAERQNMKKSKKKTQGQRDPGGVGVGVLVLVLVVGCPNFQPLSLSRISKFGSKKRWTRIELSRGNNTWTDCSWWIRILWCGGRRMLRHFRTWHR
jgi:hypothetical protein